MNAPDPAVLVQARGLLEPGAVYSPLQGLDVLTLAWGLKDLCYEAWNTEPSRAVRAAEVLRGLPRAAIPAAQAVQVDALAEWSAGIAHVTQGQMGEAVQCFDRSAALFRSVDLPDAAAQTQVPKIMALSMLGQHDSAAQCAEATQRELRDLGNLRAASRVSLNLGSLQLHRDAYAEAARHYREAAVLFARIGDREHSVLADIGLADALTSMGDFDEALRIYARARMRSAERSSDRLPAKVDESVALVELARGHYRDALAGFESARRRYAALGMPQYLAMAEKQLADTYLELRLLPEALALFDTAVLEFGALEQPVEQAWSLTQRGRTQALLGQNASAAASFADATRIFDEQDNAVGASAVALARAELALAAHDTEAAEAWADEARRGFVLAGQAEGCARADVVRAHALLRAGQVAQAGAAFEETLGKARELQQVQIQVRCLTGQAEVALARGDRVAARSGFESAIELFEDQRRALPGDEIRSAFLTDHLRPYVEMLRMAVEAGDGPQALGQLERFRARTLDERLAEGNDDALEPEAMLLRDRLNWLYRRVQKLHDESESSLALDDELRRTERELLERVRRQRLASPVAPGRSESGFDGVELQRALGTDDALVEYGVLDDELFACVATGRRITLVRRIASWAEVLEALRSTRFQIESLNLGVEIIGQHLPTLIRRAQIRLERLYAMVWEPLTEALTGCRRVIVVPHAQLGSLPFAALRDARGWLGQQCDLAVAPSARIALRGLLRRPSTARRALAIGDSNRLPHAAGEVEFVAGLFEQGRALVGEQASLQALLDSASTADILHLACHGQFRSDNPRFSALHLHEGLLTVEQAEALALRPCVVVLSACETGLSEIGGGDEMVGLVRAFLVAGAARVVATLWPVDDRVTALFMRHFYGALVSGQDTAAAVRAAQAELMRDHPHPAFWGGFTLYGGW